MIIKKEFPIKELNSTNFPIKYKKIPNPMKIGCPITRKSKNNTTTVFFLCLVTYYQGTSFDDYKLLLLIVNY
jgi:hypothetical protein